MIKLRYKIKCKTLQDVDRFMINQDFLITTPKHKGNSFLFSMFSFILLRQKQTTKKSHIENTLKRNLFFNFSKDIWMTKQAHENLLNIISQQRNANQNHMGYHFNTKVMGLKKKSDRCWWRYEKLKPSYLTK